MARKSTSMTSSPSTRLTNDDIYDLCDIYLGKPVKRGMDISVAKAVLRRCIIASISEPKREEIYQQTIRATDKEHARGIAVTAKSQHCTSIDPEHGVHLAEKMPPKPPDEEDMPRTATVRKEAAKAPPKGAAKAKANGRGRPSVGADDLIIALKDENPRRAGTAGHKAYALLLKAGKKGLRRADWYKGGGAYNHLDWDVKHGNTKVVAAKGSANARASGSYRRTSARARKR